MKKYKLHLITFMLSCLFCGVACHEPDIPTDVGNTGGSGERPSTEVEELAYVDQAVGEQTASGGTFLLHIRTSGEWTALSSEDWCKLTNESGNGRTDVMVTVSENPDNQPRSASITVTSGESKIVITVTQEKSDGSSGSNPDPEPEPDPDPTPEGYAGRIEIPKLKGGSMNKFIVHTVNYGGKEIVNFSMEYSNAHKHPWWVAFTFDNVTNKKNTGRTEKWGNDPYVDAAYRTYSSDYSDPYNRGHLCASADRTYSREANIQTFYYSNMSPQIKDFNGGVWSNMETSVRKYAEGLGAKDTLYVAKGGTLNDNQLLEYTGNHVAVPRYYYMVMVLLKNGTYKGMAYWIDQKNYDVSDTKPASYRTTIDKVEEQTGIDFFPNLPDNIETEVEANSVW